MLPGNEPSLLTLLRGEAAEREAACPTQESPNNHEQTACQTRAEIAPGHNFRWAKISRNLELALRPPGVFHRSYHVQIQTWCQRLLFRDCGRNSWLRYKDEAKFRAAGLLYAFLLS